MKCLSFSQQKNPLQSLLSLRTKYRNSFTFKKYINVSIEVDTVKIIAQNLHLIHRKGNRFRVAVVQIEIKTTLLASVARLWVDLFSSSVNPQLQGRPWVAALPYSIHLFFGDEFVWSIFSYLAIFVQFYEITFTWMSDLSAATTV